MNWFLVLLLSGPQYIGPLPVDACQAAAAAARGYLSCRQPMYLKACPIEGMPGSFTACPVFDFSQDPKVTIK